MINDLRRIQDTVEISLYADDICIWFSHRNMTHVQKKLQAALGLIEKWCDRWGMHLSPTKSRAVVFGRKEMKNIDLQIYSQSIQLEKE